MTGRRDPLEHIEKGIRELAEEVGIEIVQQLGREVPDWIVIPAGNLGNISALGRGLSMMKELGLIEKLPRIVAAQAENANPLYLSYLSGFKEYQEVAAKETLASAIQDRCPGKLRAGSEGPQGIRRDRRTGE